MFEERLQWAKTQLQADERSVEYQHTINEMLLVLWKRCETHKFSDQQIEEICQLTSSLARGHALEKPAEDELWVQARPGALVVRDVVRVHSDAYSGQAGLLHNGRIGVITAIRSGDIHVNYIDGKQSFDFVRHSPHVLDKRVK